MDALSRRESGGQPSSGVHAGAPPLIGINRGVEPDFGAPFRISPDALLPALQRDRDALWAELRELQRRRDALLRLLAAVEYAHGQVLLHG